MFNIKKIALIAFVLYSINSYASDNSFIDYQIENNHYAVIYVEAESTSSKEAKEQALKRAAELANSHGYRYFTVDAEQRVKVARTEPLQQPFHDNLYQELIIERDLGRSSISQESLPNNPIYPGLKITYTCYKDQPSLKAKVYDTCNFVSCD